VLPAGWAGAAKHDMQVLRPGRAWRHHTLHGPQLRLGNATSGKADGQRNHRDLAHVKRMVSSTNQTGEQGHCYGCTLMPRLRVALKVVTWATVAARIVLCLSMSHRAGRAEGTPFIKVASTILAQPASQVAMPI
jgi:hypothetical protein